MKTYAKLPYLPLSAVVMAAALTRLLPHEWNVSPVAAMALLVGYAIRSDSKGSVWTYGVPLCAMLISDVALELRDGTGFHALMPVVYGCMMLTVLVGSRLKRQSATRAALWGSFVASVLFFSLTNFAVWLQGVFGLGRSGKGVLGNGLYPPTMEGLVACYAAALPFFRSTLVSNTVFSVALFGVWSWVRQSSHKANAPTHPPLGDVA